MRTRHEGSSEEVRDVLGTYYRYSIGGALSSRVTLYSTLAHIPYKVMVDEVHPHWRSGQGGSMSLREYFVEHNDVSARSGFVRADGYGQVWDSDRRAILPSSSGIPSDKLEYTEGLGPDAWNRFKPLKPKVNLGQFLAELRDFPSLFKFKLRKFSDLGSDYLNAQFGWRPFLSDVRRWFQSMKRLDSQLARLKANNAKWLKRSGNLFNNQSTSQSEKTSSVVIPQNYLYDYRSTTYTSISEKAWFKGSFRYYIPGLQEGDWGNFRATSKLWGLNLTPSLVWELTPWSWLVDWVTNVGTVISNFDSVTFDNMASKGAYVMYQKITSSYTVARFTERFILNGVVTDTPKECAGLQQEIVKCRAEASPFGFNLDWNSFNPFQLSILTALGIQRFT